MRNFFLFLLAIALCASCNPSNKKVIKDDEQSHNDDDKKQDEETEESSKGAWSAADKDSYKADYAKTFKKMKQNLQGDEDFDAADFDKESKTVTSCTLKILENKYASYAAYKKASKQEAFQQDTDLMTEIADCQQEFMGKYNRE